MGSWYQTCAVTRTAIRPYQDCRLVILGKKRANFYSYCASNALYSVVDVPFKGTYCDDDGFIEIDDPEELARYRRVMTQLGFKNCADDDGENLYLDAKKMGDGHFHNNLEINFCFLSETVFEFLAEDLAVIKADFPAYVAPILENERVSVGELTDLDERMFRETFLKMPAQLLDNLSPAVYDSDCSRITKKFICTGFTSGTFFHYLYPKFDEHEEFWARLSRLAELWLVNEFLEDIRGLWMPQGGQGSQDVNQYGQYDVLIKMIQQQIAEDEE